MTAEEKYAIFDKINTPFWTIIPEAPLQSFHAIYYIKKEKRQDGSFNVVSLIRMQWVDDHIFITFGIPDHKEGYPKLEQYDTAFIRKEFVNAIPASYDNYKREAIKAVFEGHLKII